MSRARRLPSLSRLLAVLVAALVATALMPAAPAAAKKVRVDPRLFGVHDGSLRLAGPGRRVAAAVGRRHRWRDIETSPGVYDFSRLDEIVDAAQARGVEVTLVLGMTPGFYAPSPTAMPGDVGAWTRYVSAVASRYKSERQARHRRVPGLERGERQELLDRLAGADGDADQGGVERREGGRQRALVVGPAFAARIAEQTRGIGFFYNIRVSGVPVWKYMDAISLNLYPLDKYG